LPLLLAVPALETLVGWHMHQVEAGLDAAESGRDYRKHIRSVAVATVAALMPPLAAGFALAAAAYQIPYGTATRDGVLALAAGTLLGGLFAATFLLAARGRTAVAATLAAAAPLAIVALPFLPAPPLDPLPGFVAVFLVTDLLGLLAVAYTAADHETRIAQDLRRPS
jgi:peptidoglycan/LPS O-acetylase OafA/YrhL